MKHHLSEDALLYAFDQGISERAQVKLDDHADKRFTDKKAWERFLKKNGITSERDQRIATEAALLGSAISHGLKPNMLIMSDAAGQFNILIHGLCWIHEERHYRKFISLTEDEKDLINGIRDVIWNLYEQLKEYKKMPSQELRKLIEEQFDGLFSCKTESNAINDLLKNTLSRREGLLKVLDYPGLALHNNDSERDIREYVKKRKISGSTRSMLGRKTRDTFASLKKTCKKLGVCFWEYLRDRTGKLGQIQPLSELIAEYLASSNLLGFFIINQDELIEFRFVAVDIGLSDVEPPSVHTQFFFINTFADERITFNVFYLLQHIDLRKLVVLGQCWVDRKTFFHFVK